MNSALDPSEEQFFEQGERAPSEAPEELPHAPEQPEVRTVIDPGAYARRARLRRVVGSALLASVALFGLGLLRHYRAPALQLGASKPKPQAALYPMLPAALTASVPIASALVDPAPPPPPPTDPARSVDAAALIRSARTLLEAGHTRDGVAVARSAVNANPENAEPYILLAAGLQDLGKWAEAQSVFATCKQATSSGPNATCRYFAGGP
jgi:hypothetical protein